MKSITIPKLSDAYKIIKSMLVINSFKYNFPTKKSIFVIIPCFNYILYFQLRKRKLNILVINGEIENTRVYV